MSQRFGRSLQGYGRDLMPVGGTEGASRSRVGRAMATHERGRPSDHAAPILDLIIDLPDGIGTRAVEASSGKEAFEIGRKLFPGCQLAGVVREEASA